MATTTTNATTTKNVAAWLTAPKARPFQVSEAPMPAASPDEVVVRTRAVALNPVDWFIQAMGIIVPAEAYPAIIGCDLAGEVVSVGTNVAASGQFAEGDRVCGLAGGARADDGSGHKNGAFQLYAKADRGLLAKIPDSVSYAEAAVLPLGLSTAATAMFQKDAMALSLPGSSTTAFSTATDETKKKKVLLVWGGRTSVGSCAIQLAVAAGLDVATTASARNHPYCEGLGAKWVFDYHNSTIENDIVEALKGRECVGVLDAWSRGSIAQCARVLLKLGEHGGVGERKWVQTVLPSAEMVGEEVPEGVEMGYTYGTTLVNNEVGPAIWGKWVPEALASGALQCKPEPEVVAKGLDGIQTACDIGAKGWGTSSSPKLVVEII